MIDELLKKQKAFQDKYGFYPPSHAWAAAMEAECGELWAKSGGKWWKKKPNTHEEKIGELVDVLHFFFGYMLSENISSEELRIEYLKKLAENYARQERGY